MTQSSKTILEKYQVRKSKKQKSDFRDYIRSLAEKDGYRFSVEDGSFGAKNIVIGDPERANVIYTAHYDTCARLPFPNFITPKNFLIYLIYQIAVVMLFIFLPFIIIGSLFLTVAKNVGLDPELTSTIYLFIYYAVFIVFFLIMAAGPANKHTANDNTSGVTVLTDIMSVLPEERKNDVAFIFFDLEEAGLFGSKSFYSKHKAAMQSKLLVNFDCVSDGENILIVVNKKARHFTDDLAKAFKESESVHTEIATKGVFYPSDQAGFPCGVGVASLKYSKLLRTYYMDRIHTEKDTVYREENIEFLTQSAVYLAEMLAEKHEKSI